MLLCRIRFFRLFPIAGWMIKYQGYPFVKIVLASTAHLKGISTLPQTREVGFLFYFTCIQTKHEWLNTEGHFEKYMTDLPPGKKTVRVSGETDAESQEDICAYKLFLETKCHSEQSALRMLVKGMLVLQSFVKPAILLCNRSLNTYHHQTHSGFPTV